MSAKRTESYSSAAARRSYENLMIDRPQSDHRTASRDTSGQRPWFPSVAECRFFDRDEMHSRWSAAVRRAAKAPWHRRTAELGSAAHLGAFMVTADRLTEERVQEHLQRAAKVAGLRPQETERAIDRGYSLGRAHALGEIMRGGREGDRPGGFKAVASGSVTWDPENEFHVDPADLDFGSAVLIGRGHNLEREPVGVGVPTRRNGAVHIDAVFASPDFDSPAGHAWTLVRKGCLRSVSIHAAVEEYHRGPGGRLCRGTVVGVDLVRTPADERAVIGEVVESAKLTAGQRKTQQLLDRYLANPANPGGLDLFSAAVRHGAAAMDVLAPVVAPLRAELGASVA